MTEFNITAARTVTLTFIDQFFIEADTAEMAEESFVAWIKDRPDQVEFDENVIAEEIRSAIYKTPPSIEDIEILTVEEC
jgi:transcriptional regulator NrdR family protein